MAFYQFDASGLVKRYVDEIGSDWVRAIIAPSQTNIISIADVTRAEVASALSRRVREGVISVDERDELMRTFQAHCATEFRVAPTEHSIIDLAVELILRHPLRAYDGIQLATAIIVSQSLIAHNLPSLIFVSADDVLIAAAQAEGAIVHNPNRHA